eukprot:TRINITY_DN573_c0_g1_i2.p1 TRINITY_DN573_c0_g1~~TRINITY_DN573_c0_g1_i2.p1  ORF type:complete len:122 (+),score=36.18 TRINITY_DN573_c0_g1_i2:37-402(+)
MKEVEPSLEEGKAAAKKKQKKPTTGAAKAKEESMEDKAVKTSSTKKRKNKEGTKPRGKRLKNLIQESVVLYGRSPLLQGVRKHHSSQRRKIEEHQELCVKVRRSDVSFAREVVFSHIGAEI